MNKQFYFDEVEDKQVRFDVTRIIEHASLWSDGVEEERILKNKERINSWNKMKGKLRDKFLPQDYMLVSFRKMKNIEHKSMTVREFTEEFYKVNIRSGHIEDTPDKFPRCVNSLRFDIQDELIFLSLISIEEAYQVSFKVGEKLMTKQSQKAKVRGVIADFTTHGGSHLYGLPYPFADALDPMEHFCTFDISKIIPKKMSYLIYPTFKPILTYIPVFYS